MYKMPKLNFNPKPNANLNLKPNDNPKPNPNPMLRNVCMYVCMYRSFYIASPKAKVSQQRSSCC